MSLIKLPGSGLNYYNFGFNSGATSIDLGIGDFSVNFKVKDTSKDIFIGLNPNSDTGPGYLDIIFGFEFYIDSGIPSVRPMCSNYGLNTQPYLLIESGGNVTYNSNDIFSISRFNGVIRYFKNNVEIARVALIPDINFPYIRDAIINDPMIIDCSMFAVGDEILDINFSIPIMNYKNVYQEKMVFDTNLVFDVNTIVLNGQQVYIQPINFDIGNTDTTFYYNINKLNIGSINNNIENPENIISNFSYTSSVNILDNPENIIYDDQTNPYYTYNIGNSLINLLSVPENSTGVNIATSTSSVNILDNPENIIYDHNVGFATNDIYFEENLIKEKLNNYTNKKIPSLRINANAIIGTLNKLEKSIKILSLKSNTGANLVNSINTLSTVASSTNPIVGRLNSSLSKLKLNSTSTTSALGNLNRKITSLISIKSYCGSNLKSNLSKLKSKSTAITGATSSLKSNLSKLKLNSNASVENVSSLNSKLPILKLNSNVSKLNSTLPKLLLTSNSILLSNKSIAYVINLNHNKSVNPNDIEVDEITYYTNYNFDNIVRLGNKYYGVKSDGLYLIDGNTDNLLPIKYEFETNLTDFDNSKLKTISEMRIGGRVGSSASVSIVNGEYGNTQYNYGNIRSNKAQNHRVVFGKGIKSRYYGFNIKDTAEDIDINAIEFELDILNRSI